MFALILIGKKLSLLSIIDPISLSGLIIRCIGLLDNDLSPTSVASIFLLAKNPARSLAVVPEFPQCRALLGLENSFPFTVV